MTSAISADELAFTSATSLLEHYRGGALSPVEVTEAILARIDAIDPLLNCYCLVDREAALDAARASQARWSAGEPAGRLDGVPVSIKDLLLTRGWPTLRGSRTIDRAGPWQVDAPAVARLREQGAVLLGKTTTPEIGWRASTDCQLTGITRNPWNREMTPGGSSGGAAAAVAAGLGPLAVGTDGGGSIRIPAAFTGTVGLKPNFGRVPAFPLSPMGSVAHVGPIARTARDCALLLDVIALPEHRDWLSLPPPERRWSDEIELGIEGLRIGFSPRLGYVSHVDAEIAKAVRDAAHCLESLGAIVEEVDPGLPDSHDAFAVHWFSSARHALRRLTREQFELVDPGLQAVYEAAERYTLSDFLDAQAMRGEMGVRMREFHVRYDLLLTPATAQQPFEVGSVMPQLPHGMAPVEPFDWSWWTPFSYPFNLTQQPALVQGCGFGRSGLPLALQWVASHHREDLCLRAAHAYQQITDWHQRRPAIGE